MNGVIPGGLGARLQPITRVTWVILGDDLFQDALAPHLGAYQRLEGRWTDAGTIPPPFDRAPRRVAGDREKPVLDPPPSVTG